MQTISPGTPDVGLGRTLAIAIAVVFVFALLREVLLPDLGTRVAFVTCYPTVVVAALLGGFRAGMLATLLSSVVADYFWLEPRWSFIPENSIDWVALAMFIATGALVSVTSEAMRRTNFKLAQEKKHQRKMLEDQVAERTAELSMEVQQHRDTEQALVGISSM